MAFMTPATRWIESTLSPFPYMVAWQQRYYRNCVAEEIHLGHINATDRVLCIGAGPLPCTAIEIANRCGARIVAIDCDAAAVECAQHTIAQLGLQAIIEMEQADGRDYDAGGFDVVHIARQAVPQADILARVWATARLGARIILRRPHLWLRPLYEGLKPLKSRCHGSCAALSKHTAAGHTLCWCKGQLTEPVDPILASALQRTAESTLEH